MLDAIQKCENKPFKKTAEKKVIEILKENMCSNMMGPRTVINKDERSHYLYILNQIDGMFIDDVRDMISNAIEKFLNRTSEFDTLNSAHLIKEFMWQNNLPLNYSLDNMPKSQNLPDIYALNFALNLFERDYAIKNSSIVGQHPLLFKLDEVESIDIDNEIDFEFAEFMYKKYRM